MFSFLFVLPSYLSVSFPYLFVSSLLPFYLFLPFLDEASAIFRSAPAPFPKYESLVLRFGTAIELVLIEAHDATSSLKR
jgi:hypothetical protein